MAKQSRAEKLMDREVEVAYYASCSGIQVDIMDIGKVFAKGRELIAAGKHGEELQAGIRAFVDTIKKN